MKIVIHKLVVVHKLDMSMTLLHVILYSQILLLQSYVVPLYSLCVD